MPLTPLRRRKLERLFSILDLDQDGRITKADFLRRVEALARIRGWSEDSAEYTRHVQFSLEEWRSLCESADVDEDAEVSLQEFMRYGEVYLDDRDAVRAYARGDVQLLFDAMDTDGDGKLDVEDYRSYLEACGADASAADVFFRHADLDEDGRISRTEMSHAVEEFFVSEDPSSAGNFLFGPLAETPGR